MIQAAVRYGRPLFKNFFGGGTHLLPHELYLQSHRFADLSEKLTWILWIIALSVQYSGFFHAITASARGTFCTLYPIPDPDSIASVRSRSLWGRQQEHNPTCKAQGKWFCHKHFRREGILWGEISLGWYAVTESPGAFFMTFSRMPVAGPKPNQHLLGRKDRTWKGTEHGRRKMNFTWTRADTWILQQDRY